MVESSNESKEGVEPSEMIAALACCYCGVILGILAYIVVGIYFMVVDRYTCAETTQDMLWMYAILVLTLPLGFQYILSTMVHEDSVFTRLTATGTVVLAFIIYGSIVLFGGNVCDEQIAKGGLYVWVWVQYSLSIFCFIVLLYVIANPSVLASMSSGAAAEEYKEPLVRPTTSSEATAQVDDMETGYQEAGID